MSETPRIAAPDGWTLAAEGTRLRVEMRTPDFAAALSLFQEVGAVAEALDHHPDLHLERWNHVRIETYSHDVGHLTARDERLAQRIHEILLRRGLAPRGGP